ncbi:hypothetical protein H6G89_32845 [Oscillatoria sp. FACHB-1407]|uniref:hypothetical protein n=1 Tax=Oscillatoria sp. FACHB-1407 TaxID=2692847 RepID=UPI00168658E9|nr:hypothetical protein [Oscillatoria sp. FACHB-1407]MBD2465779.1 hypothetical protein [Oscillatoria sp. FACHB-1407]
MGLNRYDSRDEVYVNPFQGSGINYGFLTNVNSERRGVLGHTAVDRSALPPAIVFGANAPKPGRASRKFADGHAASFYDIAQVAALRSAGWSLTRPFIRRARTSDLASTRFVTVGGIKYAWQLNNTTATRIGGDLAGLGVQTPTQNDRDLVFGASYPKPPRAVRITDTGSSQDSVSTFADPSRADSLPAGWRIQGREFVA